MLNMQRLQLQSASGLAIPRFLARLTIAAAIRFDVRILCSKFMTSLTVSLLRFRCMAEIFPMRNLYEMVGIDTARVVACVVNF